MSTHSDPGPPRDPAAYRPRRMLGVGFWALIALSVLCVLAGAGVAYFGPRLLPRRPAVPAAPAPPASSIPAPPDAAQASAAEVARLQAQIATLESQGARSNEAAAAAIAAAGVIDASRTSAPFAAEVAELQKTSPDLPELAALARLAAVGAPSRTALAASFPDFAARASVKARKPGDNAKVGARVIYAISSVVQVRRVDDLAGAGPDARLARAEQALSDGDVAGALKSLDGLPPAAQRALEPWRVGAERRADIDRLAAALRARAISDLAADRSGA